MIYIQSSLAPSSSSPPAASVMASVISSLGSPSAKSANPAVTAFEAFVVAIVTFSVTAPAYAPLWPDLWLIARPYSSYSSCSFFYELQKWNIWQRTSETFRKATEITMSVIDGQKSNFVRLYYLCKMGTVKMCAKRYYTSIRFELSLFKWKSLGTFYLRYKEVQIQDRLGDKLVP